MTRIFLLLGLMAATLQVQAGELYRWADEKGKVHYGDAPPPAVDVEEKNFHDPAGPDAGLSYETRRARQYFPVTLYVSDNCGELCARARELLKQRGIPFGEKKLVLQAEIDAFKAASGGDRAPALGVGKGFVHGFNSGRWHSELDAAGYPKTAPYRPRTAP